MSAEISACLQAQTWSLVKQPAHQMLLANGSIELNKSLKVVLIGLRLDKWLEASLNNMELTLRRCLARLLNLPQLDLFLILLLISLANQTSGC